MDKEEEHSDSEWDFPTSSHDRVMEAFNDIGFAVCFRVVNPADYSCPTSRPRIHYQGLDRNRVKDADMHMDALLRLWGEWEHLLKLDPYPCCLEDWLLEGDKLKEQQGPLRSRAAQPQEGKLWEGKHKAFFEKKEVGT